MLENIEKMGPLDFMDGLMETMRERHSSRGPFQLDQPLPPGALEQILEAARWAPTAHNMQNFEIIVVDDKNVLEKIGKIPSGLSSAFIRENYLQMSFTKEEFLRKKKGVLADMFPPSWHAPEARYGKVDSADGRAHLWDTIQGGPVLLVVLYDSTHHAPASDHDLLGFISLGCVMENMWLTAHSLGLGFQIISALSSNMVGDKIENDARQILGFPDVMKIAFCCRLGCLSSERLDYLRVRRDIEDFVHHDVYRNHGLK
jgi:nitroreductase